MKENVRKCNKESTKKKIRNTGMKKSGKERKKGRKKERKKFTNEG